MSDEEVQIEFDVDDKASPKLSKMEKAAERLDKAVGRTSERFMRFAEMAGAAAGVFGAVESLRGAKEYLEHVHRISNLTGIAADNVAGMSEALQTTGVETGEIEGMLTRMTKRTALLGEDNKAMVKMAERYGVNLSKGPQAALIKMSQLVEDNKIGAGQVGRIIGVQGKTLSNLMEAMHKGPEELKSMFDEATEKNAFLGGQTMDQMQSYNEAVEKVHGAWKRLVAGVIVRVAPQLEKLASRLGDSIETWIPKAQKFASMMISHMGTMITMAKTYAKIMLVNNLAEKLTGKGIVGNVMRLGSNTGGGILGGVGSGAASIVKQLFTGVIKIRPLLTIFARFAVVAGIVGIIYYLFMKITTATEGAGLRIRELFDRIWANLQAVGRQFENMFSADSTLGKFFRWLGEEGLLGLVEKITQALDNIVFGLRIIATMLTEHTGFGGAKDIIIGQTYKDSGLEKMVKGGLTPSLSGEVPGGPTSAITAQMRQRFADFDKARAQYEAVGGPKMWSKGQLDALRTRYGSPAKSNATPENNVYQDFRGSRFDVTQQFAEGFDPDRIAVGFANDIAALGERRLQSGFSPLFAVR